MHKIIETKSSITKKLMSKSDALNVFKSLNEPYKQEPLLMIQSKKMIFSFIIKIMMSLLIYVEDLIYQI